MTLRARWVTLRARWVTLTARWVTPGVARGAAATRGGGGSELKGAESLTPDELRAANKALVERMREMLGTPLSRSLVREER